MVNSNQEFEYSRNTILNILAGLLIGSLAGAVAMLLMAPKSGKETRIQIQKKGIQLRHRTADMVEDTMAKVRSNAKKIATRGRRQIKEFKHLGKELAFEQLDHVSDVVKASRAAVKNS